MQTYARFFSKTNQVMTVEALLYGFDASDKKYAENVWCTPQHLVDPHFWLLIGSSVLQL